MISFVYEQRPQYAFDPIDPSGGWASKGLFAGLNTWGEVLATTLGGAAIGGAIDALTGGGGWSGAAIGAGIGLGSNFVTTIVAQLNNLATSLPAVGGSILDVLKRPTTAPSSPSNRDGTSNSLIRIYIKEGKSKSDGGGNSWDKWDGHTLLQIDEVIYHFYPTGIRKGRDLYDQGFSENKAELKETWNSDGEVGSMNINDPKTNEYFRRREHDKYGFSVFELPITQEQKASLLNSIRYSVANPPAYSTFGTRCQSWCSGVLRSASILPPDIRQFSWSTVPFSKALYRMFPKTSLIYKSFSSKFP